MRLEVRSSRMCCLWLKSYHHIHTDDNGRILLSTVVTSCQRSSIGKRSHHTHLTIDLPMNLCCYVGLWTFVVYSLSLWTCELVKWWICELVNLWTCVVDMWCNCRYWIVCSGKVRLGLKCCKHRRHCTNHPTLSSVTGATLGVVVDHVVNQLLDNVTDSRSHI
jgi:hypothetical protein